jgi:hypothetical protein
MGLGFCGFLERDEFRGIKSRAAHVNSAVPDRRGPLRFERVSKAFGIYPIFLQ